MDLDRNELDVFNLNKNFFFRYKFASARLFLYSSMKKYLLHIYTLKMLYSQRN